MKLGQQTDNTKYKQNKFNKEVPYKKKQKTKKKIGDKCRHFINQN